jgi:hypothetical protein
VPLHQDSPACGEGRKRLLRLVPEGLPLLRRVDSGQPDLVLPPRPVEDGQRVSVGDGDHAPGERVGEGGRDGEGEEQQQAARAR